MVKKGLFLALVAFSLTSVLSQSAIGKEYPSKPIELVCPFTAGSGMDLYSRLIADKVHKYLGQPMVVINKAGAGGTTAFADLASSKPDGYKVVVHATSYFGIVVKTQRIPFNPKDIVPLIPFVEYKLGLQVRGDSPWKTLNDLLIYAKENPGKLRWGHGGRGLDTHIDTMLVFKKAGVNTVEIPYKGAPEPIAALLGGHLDAVTFPYGSVASFIKAGTIKYLVVYSEKGYSSLPNVPTAKQMGFPEAIIKPWVAIFVHKDTPEGVKKILFDALKKTFEDPEFKKEIEQLGDEPVSTSGQPELTLELIKKTEQISVPALKELGLYIEN